MEEKKYTRREIKNAIAQELMEAEHMGMENGNYYTVVGIIMEALDRLDNKQK